jgi:hypothetical protein
MQHQNHFSLDQFFCTLEFGQRRVRVERSEDGVVHVRRTREVAANGLASKPQFLLASPTEFLLGQMVEVSLKGNMHL